MQYTELFSDLTFDLAQNEDSLIKVNGSISSCIISVQFLDAGSPTYTVKSSVDSSEFVDEAEELTDIFFENIVIDDVEVAELTTEIKSMMFASPNFIYVKNISAAETSIKVSLRGNR